MKQLWERAGRFWREEDGLGTLEMLLILAVIVVLAITFRKWIMSWVDNLFSKANDGMDTFEKIAPSVMPK